MCAAGPDRFWARSAQKREREREPKFCFFLSDKQRAISPTSGRPNFTKFAYQTWIYVRMNPVGKHFWKFARKGSFSENVKFCLNVVNDFWLQAVISPKWIQIAESRDRLARLWNVGFPSIPLESTESHSPGLYSAHNVYFPMRLHAWFTYLKILTVELAAEL